MAALKWLSPKLFCLNFKKSKLISVKSLGLNLINHRPYCYCVAGVGIKSFQLRHGILSNMLTSTEGSFFSTTSHAEVTKSTFAHMMHFRKEQAQRTVLVELSNRKQIGHASQACSQFGAIKNLFSYNGESNNVFLLLEFEEKESVVNMLASCQCKNIADAFPVFSRIICFEKNYKHDTPIFVSPVLEDTMNNSVNFESTTISSLITDIFLSERISDLNLRLRFFFCTLIKESLSGLYPHCDVLPFGSSVNGIGKQGCDLDVMLRLYPESVNLSSEFSFLNKTCIGDPRALQQKTVLCVGDIIRTMLPGVTSLQKITHARVPIMKFTHKILRMDCDISVNNMSAIFMSDILHTCGEIDSRVRPLMYAIKKWAKEANVTFDSPGSWITNFALSLLTIHFLQNRQIPILPCLNDICKINGAELTDAFRLEYTQPLPDLQSRALMNKESLAELLRDFLSYLGSHPFKNSMISVLTGEAVVKNSSSPIWVQYPLEEALNVTRNVTEKELKDMCDKAQFSASMLESNMDVKVSHPRDLSAVLGVHHIQKVDASQRSKKLDISALLVEEAGKTSKRKPDRRRAF